MKFKKLSELPIEEAKDILINIISGHTHEPEIINLLSIFSTYNFKTEHYLKSEYYELSTEEIIERLNKQFNGTSDDEESAWKVLENSIGFDKALEIIDNFKKYQEKLNELEQSIQNIKYISLSLLTST